MAFLRHGELRRFSTAAGELLEKPDEELSLSNFLLGTVARLIPLDRVSYNEVDRMDGRLVTAHSFNEAADPSLIEGLNRHIHEHPGFARTDPTDPCPAPTLLSDHLSQRQFRQLGLYHEHFRLYGIHYQLGVSFAVSPERRISFGLNRATRDFREEDRLMLGLLRQHLAAAWRRAQSQREIEREIALRDDALAGVGAAVVLLESSAKITFRNPQADGMMGRYGVTAALLAWAQAHVAKSGGQTRVTVKREWGCLTAVLTPAPQDGGWYFLRLTERPSLHSPQSLQRLGLARREAEVLFWLAQGKRNTEIAVICGMRPTTVGTHLRTIFAKLGVETRTAAAALAWDTLADDTGFEGNSLVW